QTGRPQACSRPVVIAPAIERFVHATPVSPTSNHPAFLRRDPFAPFGIGRAMPVTSRGAKGDAGLFCKRLAALSSALLLTSPRPAPSEANERRRCQREPVKRSTLAGERDAQHIARLL